MFGIKTKIINSFDRLFSRNFSNKDVIKELMIAFSADEYGHQANTNKGDLGYGWIHYGLIRKEKPKNILCIGSRHGYIPAVLAQACKDNNFGHVDFVDAGFSEDQSGGWTGVGYWKTKKGKACFNAFGLEKFISLYVQKTEEYASKFPNKTYEYIYVDGDHSFDGVSLDFKLFFPRLNKNGFMVFHDICVKGIKLEGEYGVWKLWEILEKKFDTLHIHFLGSGLGILQKRKNTYN